MRSIFLFSGIFICAFSLSSKAADVRTGSQLTSMQNKEITRFYLAHIVASQPAMVGYERFADSLGLKSYIQPGKELFQKAKKIKSWPQIQVTSFNSITFQSKGKKHTLTIKDFIAQKYELDGKAIQVNLKKKILPQIEEVLSLRERGVLPFSLISEAVAADGDPGLELSIATTVVGAGLGGAALAGGAALGSAGAVAGVGAAAVWGSVCGTLAFKKEWSTGIKLEGETYWKRFLDCSSSPLRMVGLSSRDYLVVDDIKCKSDIPVENGGRSDDGIHTDAIVVTLRSPSGKKETRTFTTDRIVVAPTNSIHNLSYIEITNEDYDSVFYVKEGRRLDLVAYTQQKGKKDSFVKRAKMDGQGVLGQMQIGLFRDYEYYRSLCEDPKQLSALLKDIHSHKAEARVYNEKSLQDVERESRSAE